MRAKRFLMGVLMLVLVALLAACNQTTETPTAEQEVTPCPTAEPCPECPTCPEVEESGLENVPFEAAWASSAHADADAEAFRHWDEDGEIQESCAKCHSSGGYLDYLGADGSEFRVVNQPAELGSVVTCETCHNDVTATLTSVVFPSGVEVTGLDASARCMECHQGRASTVQVNDAITELGLEGDEDATSADLGFVNIHYYAAAATLLGTEVQGGYQYEGQTYQPKFEHVEGYNSCAECHDSHSLELKVEQCAECHTGVGAVEDLHDVRMQGSLVDYDGDGDVEEGIYYEVQGLQEMLYQAIQTYASDVIGTPIVYNSAAHPYFFIDANENGEADEADTEAYNVFSARLLKAAYNYQVAVKDPGAYAHNAKYIIELLYDSIASLNEQVAEPVDLSAARRDDAGHFDASAEAFRHWDEEGEVASTCSKCHTSEGLPALIETGSLMAFAPSSGLSCSTCHQNFEDFATYEVAEVTFPSGAVLGFADDTQSNLCINCHQGRESTVSVDAAISAAGVGPDQVSEDLHFTNPHYFAAGATLFGSEAQGAYQYAGRTYAARFEHIGGFDSCQECHNAHSLEVENEECATCHGTDVLEEIRAPEGDPVDYDGDGDVDEGIAGEIETMHEMLGEAIGAYTTDTLGDPITYNSGRYPYWFDEAGEGYASWTPKLLRAAYNYQYVAKDPGAFAHNGTYIMQVLYDSIQDVGGSTEGMTRPTEQ